METKTAKAAGAGARTDYRRAARTIGRTLGLAWRASPTSFIALATLTIVTALAPPIVVALSRELVDRVASPVGGGDVPVNDLLPWAVAIGLVSAGQRVLQAVQSTRQWRYSREVNLYVERQFLEKASQSELSRFDDPAWHDQAARVSESVGYRPFNLTYQIIGMAGSAVTLLGMFGVLLSLHPVVLGLVLLAVLVPLPFQRGINRRIYAFTFGFTPRQREGRYYRWLLSDPQAAKDLRAFVLERRLLARHEAVVLEEMAQHRSLYRRAEGIWAATGLASGLALAGAFVFVADRAAAGALTPGDVAALIGAIASVTGLVSVLFTSLIGVDEHAPYLEDFFTFLGVEPVIRVPEDPVAIPSPLRRGIALKGVTFTYPDRTARHFKASISR